MQRLASVLRLGAPLLLALGACSDGAHTFAGVTRDPEPVVDGTPLPDLAAGGEPFAMRAEPGGLLVVFFGFTNCPDVCPTTLADVRIAMEILEEDDITAVDLAMVTVDPGRDLPLLADYVQRFVPDGHALGSDDPAALRDAAAPFGVAYEVATAPDGAIQVGHSPQLFVVDDRGRLILTWSYGTPASELAADLDALLDTRA